MNASVIPPPFNGFLPHSVKLYPMVQLLPEQQFPGPNSWPRRKNIVRNDTQAIEGIDNQIYIHVPFCPFFCHFCPLYKVQEKRLSTKEVKEMYVKSLSKEIEMYGRSGAVEGKIFNTIYFGGGTPTELTSGQISGIINSLRENFQISSDAEITLEGVARQMDNASYLNECFDSGINRISFGVQSLSQPLRKTIGRGDAVSDYVALIERAKKINSSIIINVEIMAGLPTQTFDVFCQDLDEISKWNINSLDILYYVMLPETKLYNKIVEKKVEHPSYGQRMMEFRQYSNRKLQEMGYKMQTGEVFVKSERDLFTRSAFGNKENTVLALGPSSFGFIDKVVYQNVCSLEHYISSLERDVFPVFKQKQLAEKVLNKRRLLFTLLKLEPINGDLIKKNNVERLMKRWLKKGLVTPASDGYVFTEKGKLWYNHMQIDALSLREKFLLLQFFGTKDNILKMYEAESKTHRGPVTELLNLIKVPGVYGFLRYYGFLAILFFSSKLHLMNRSALGYLGVLKTRRG